ncbi:MAG: 4-alpha-glucanotransferase [Prevotella sp.]|nr:4-alpha-glucanotransferase [Prevotella sp.]
MNLKFHIEYQTVYGQELVLNIVKGKQNEDKEVSEYRMQTDDGCHWECNVNCKANVGTSLDYYYSVLRGDHTERKEWGVVAHRLEITAKNGVNYCVFDHWIDIPEDSFLYTSAVTDCVVGKKLMKTKLSDYKKTVRLKVRAPQLRKGESLGVLGMGVQLGNWQPSGLLRMTEHHINEWIIDIDATRLLEPFLEFKFVAFNADKGVISCWEKSDNRIVRLPEMHDGDVMVYELSQAWFDIAPLKCAGTLVPVFSLRSETSFGVGDFGDLQKMIDWTEQTGQRVLQILPVNDTTITHTWMDSYPYSCISIFALHPQYVDLIQLPEIKDIELRKEMEALRLELNALPQIDYERVNEAKTRCLQTIYEQEGKAILTSKDFKAFFKEAEHWLVPYAAYCYLRDTYGTADFSQWPEYNSWDEKERVALSNPRSKKYQKVAFYYFTQFVLASQMKAVHEYARAKNVILKGDIPIGVNRYGCDVWAEPRYFNLNGQAGAPPDDFSVNGQNWGFPTYNWDAMLEDGCQWWVRRFQNMSQYFDAYRIDHVLGFFRIWEIPADAVHGLLGHFSPSLGMTREEIEGYGLHWQEELFTEPFITDWVLERIFGERTSFVKENYLEQKADGCYRMRSAFDTQKKIEASFKGKDAEEDIWLRDGLYALISDVLFVRDHKDANKFHPRISVQFDFIYESLFDSDKFVFNRLYNDYFYRRNNQFWYREAMKKLPLLVDATRMLVCAEDLGMVPDCVSWVMNELRILSLELQSMPKDSHVRFGHLSRNPYRSVCTISSHDMPTLRQWWDEDEERTQSYYNTMLYRGDVAPHPLPGWLARDIISRHLTSPSMLCILSIQDWLAMDEKLRLTDQNAERINIPANPKHYWRYRMHITIENLMKNVDFTKEIAELVSSSGRK